MIPPSASQPWQPDNKAAQPCQGPAASTPRPGTRSPAPPRESAGSGSAASGNIRCVMPRISPGTSTIFISIRSSTALQSARGIGRTHRFAKRLRAGSIRPVGCLRARTRAILARGGPAKGQAEAGTMSWRHLGSVASGGVRKRTPPLATALRLLCVYLGHRSECAFALIPPRPAPLQSAWRSGHANACGLRDWRSGG